MKAADRSESKHYRERLSDSLQALGLMEEATYVVESGREEDRSLALATDPALVIVTQSADRLGAYVLDLEVYPWAAVEGLPVTAHAVHSAEGTVTYATVETKVPKLGITPPEYRSQESVDFAAACLAHM